MGIVTHSNLTLTASLVGDYVAEHVGDTFIDWRHLAPTRQWQRIVQMLLSAPLEVRRDLLDALGHGDCVPREEANDVAFSQLKRAGELTDRAERAERERDELRNRFERLADDAANWPFGKDDHLWQMHEKRDFARWLRNRAALSADADADAEPSPRDAELRDRAEQVAAGGADFCTAWNDEFGLCDRPPDHPGAHERVTGLGATVTWRDPEPSRAEG